MAKYTSYKILPEYEVIICNLQGTVVLNDLIELNRQFITDSLFNPLFSVILDFRDALAIGYRIDVAEYVKFFKESVTLKKKVKVGILYNTPNQEFLFNIYKTFGKLLKLDIEIFRQVDLALKWMEFSEAGQEEIKFTLKTIKALNFRDV